MKKPRYPHRRASRLLGLCVVVGLFPFLVGANHATVTGPVRIIFLHHSCGQNLIEQGGVRETLTMMGYEFYDHGYNEEGLRLADGSYTGTNFDVPDDNTDPDGLATIFAQPLHDPPDNTFSHLMAYDIIAFKSCFPVSNIGSDEQLEEYKSYYLSVRDRMDQYLEKRFVVVTQPPQVPANSDSKEARRARALANWLNSDEFTAGRSNVYVFDFFGHLAGDDNFLRPEYRADEYDAHPNERANGEIGPLFAAFLAKAAGMPLAPALPPPTESPAQSPAPPSAAPPPAPGVVDGFEEAADQWESSAGGGDSTMECWPDTAQTHSGAVSLRMRYSIAPGGWADCGRAFESVQDWSGGNGLGMWLHSDEAGMWLTLIVFSGDTDEPTPFEVGFETTSQGVGDWEQFVFSWEDFSRAEWASEEGLAELDPARVTGYAFSIGADDDLNEGTLWVDDVELVLAGGGEQPLPGGPGEEPGEEPEEGPAEEEEPAGGICPCTAAALSLGALGVVLVSRRRR
jgi:hypothetical protein